MVTLQKNYLNLKIKMKFFHSPKGYLCAAFQGKNIHSQYNPQKEAARFIKASVSGTPSMIIFLGAGLGYVQEEICNNYSSVPVLAIYYNDELYKKRQFSNENISCWFPSSNEDLNSFFQKNIEEKSLKDLLFVEWNPSALIFRDSSLSANKILKNVIQQLNGNIKTTAVFGKKWIRNMLCNYLSIEKYCTMDRQITPIVIASSGPSLVDSLGILKKYRNKYRLWALPSSLKALDENYLIPDLVISTDPGYYGSYHLNYLKKNIPVALPLTASRGLWRNDNPLMILNQNSPFEKELFQLSSLKPYAIPPNGTVAGTALELASRVSQNIYFTGLDLCFYDIKSHISPHSFDSLLTSESGRFNPYQNIYFRRAFDAVPDFNKGIRTSRSLDTYKNWFNNHSSNLPVKRINPSPVKIENMSTGNFEELNLFPDLDPQEIITFNAENRNLRRNTISTLLKSWEKRIIENNREELLYFIDTDSYYSENTNLKALNFVKELWRIYG